MKQCMDHHFSVGGRTAAARTQAAAAASSTRATGRTSCEPGHPGRENVRRSERHVLPPAPIKFFVALQADERIAEMNRTELIDLIRLSELPPVCEGTWERLRYLERGDLERLAFLTRRCCRNQINSYSHHVGRSAPFISDM